MKLFHKGISIFLSLALIVSASACTGSSKGAPDESETPVEVGDEGELALPPE